MKNDGFKRFCEYVKNAEENDPIWYAGYLWLELTEKQINQIVSIIRTGKMGVEFTIGNILFSRNIVQTPSGMRLYGDSEIVLISIKDLVTGCSVSHAQSIILDFYNERFITCGEYRELYDWISDHGDDDGRVSEGWR